MYEVRRAVLLCGIGVAIVEPKRTVLPEYAADLGENANKYADVLVEGVFQTDLSIGPRGTAMGAAIAELDGLEVENWFSWSGDAIR